MKHVTEQEEEAKDFYTLAYTIYTKHLGEDNESVLAIQKSLEELQA